MSLSDKKQLMNFSSKKGYTAMYPEKDVKEFIKKLKEELGNPQFFSPAQYMIIKEFIDKLAGENLI